MTQGTKTANYKITTDASGKVVSFYCALSGMYVCRCTVPVALADEAAVLTAWETEGRNHFDKCHKCGRWVSSVMFNADVLACVDCVPWEDSPKFCAWCGEKVKKGEEFCSRCGKKLQYGGD